MKLSYSILLLTAAMLAETTSAVEIKTQIKEEEARGKRSRGCKCFGGCYKCRGANEPDLVATQKFTSVEASSEYSMLYSDAKDLSNLTVGSTTSGDINSNFGAWCARNAVIDEGLHLNFDKPTRISATGLQGKPLANGDISYYVDQYLLVVYSCAGEWKALKDDKWVDYDPTKDADYDLF